jgi:hypothetical protein
VIAAGQVARRRGPRQAGHRPVMRPTQRI